MGHDFFKIISRIQFQDLLRNFPATEALEIPIDAGYKKVLASNVFSAEDLPPVNRSCMDGFAVNAEDVFGSGETNPSYLECVADLAVNQFPDFCLKTGECAKIPTGGTLPEGSNAVIMVEHTKEMGAGTIEIRKSATPGENAMLKGEDCTKNELIFKKGHKLRFQDIGLLAALGIDKINVHKKPDIGIISTGDELVEISSPQIPGTVRDVNSSTLRCMISESGGNPVNYGIVKDDLKKLKSTLEQALAENNLVLLSGGSSVGMRDLTVQAIDAMKNSRILAHGVAISPGKPTILGESEGKPILGLPGQVTSMQVVMLVLVMPFIRHLMGEENAFAVTDRNLCPAELARNTASKSGREDYVRVKLEYRQYDKPLAHPVLGKSGLLKTMVNSDGLMIIPADTEGSYAGQGIKVWRI